MNIQLSTGQSVGVGMTVLQVSRDGRSLFVSHPYPELGGRWYGPEVVGVRTIGIERSLFSKHEWRGFSRGVDLRFDEFRLRKVKPFRLRAGSTYVLFFDADHYPQVIRLRPTEVNQLQAYRVLLLAGVEDVACRDDLCDRSFSHARDICVTDGLMQIEEGSVDQETQSMHVYRGTFVLVRHREGDPVWTRAYITPDCDVQALTLSLTRTVPQPTPVAT